MDKYKKLNIGLGIITAIIAMGTWFYWQYVCKDVACDIYFIKGIIKPLLFGNLALSIILTSLLVFPSRFFKQWLIHIASWTLVFSLYFLLQENPRSASILSFGRGLLSWTLGSLLLSLTIIYTIGWHMYEFKKGRLAKKDFAKLSVFLISGAIFYQIWQLF